MARALAYMEQIKSTPSTDTLFVLGVPAYNEEAVIGETVQTLIRHLGEGSFTWRILVLNNASTDRTKEVVERINDSRVLVLDVPEKGKGNAVRSGARCARMQGATVYGFIDADLSADPRHIGMFVTKLHQGGADIVIGSRLVDKTRVARSGLRTFTSEAFNRLRRVLFGMDIVDTQCGLKCCNEKGMEVLARGKEAGWFWDIEFLAHSLDRNLAVCEEPVDWDEFRYTNRKSKLRLVRDGVGAVAALLRIKVRMLQSR